MCVELYNLLTYLALSGPQVVHRSARKFPKADRSPAIAITSLWSRLFSLISRFIVLFQVYLGLTTFLLPVGVQLMAYLDSLLPGMRSTCPYHLHHRILITSTTDCCPALFLSLISLTWSYHLIFIMALNHPLSNLLALFSIYFKPLQDSHPYIRTDITIL